jgi:hypothetical protein
MFFPSTVTLEPFISKDGYGDSKYGSPIYPECRYAKIEKFIDGFGNQQFRTCAWVQLPAGTVIGKEDKIMLPDNTTAPIVSFNRVRNHVDIEVCVEIWLGEEIRGGF